MKILDENPKLDLLFRVFFRPLNMFWVFVNIFLLWEKSVPKTKNNGFLRDSCVGMAFAFSIVGWQIYFIIYCISWIEVISHLFF